MTNASDDVPSIEPPEPFEREDAAEIAGLDNEVDFDDEHDDDQLPLDIVEAIEADALLDDPETISEDS